MKALIIKGHKNSKGKEIDTLGWDSSGLFTVTDHWDKKEMVYDVTKTVKKKFRPTFLAFKMEDMRELSDHMLFYFVIELFQPTKAPDWAKELGYEVTFKPRRFASQIRGVAI